MGTDKNTFESPVSLSIKTHPSGARGMAQGLRAQTELPEDPSLIPRTLMEAHNNL